MFGRTPGAALTLIACLALHSGAAQADARLTAHFKISMTGVSIGQMSWIVDISAGTYTTSTNGRSSGALSMLMNGEGRVAARGFIDTDRLRPTFFSSSGTEDGETAGVQMTFENSNVKTLRLDAPRKKDDRIPVSDADKRGVSDPLSAMLIIAPPRDPSIMDPAHCDRTLPVFDGQRRYDLSLTYKRSDTIKVETGYAGPALVCAVTLKPIAGYRADSMVVKYVAGRRDMEIWFAPIAGTDMIAPARLVMPTLLGTLEIAADRFEALALKSTSPAISPGTPLPPAMGPTDPPK